VMASPEPLYGAALIARFMAGVAEVRRRFGGFELRMVHVNGQPGRIVRGPDEPEFGEAQRAAAARAATALRSSSFDPDAMAERMLAGREVPVPGEAKHIWEVLTVDVVDGRIQTVRIVRNPDKLAHL
jgi:RNA polymerase sigma-70 factor (ECF subfamily)